MVLHGCVVCCVHDDGGSDDDDGESDDDDWESDDDDGESDDVETTHALSLPLSPPPSLPLPILLIAIIPCIWLGITTNASNSILSKWFVNSYHKTSAIAPTGDKCIFFCKALFI